MRAPELRFTSTGWDTVKRRARRSAEVGSESYVQEEGLSGYVALARAVIMVEKVRATQ